MTSDRGRDLVSYLEVRRAAVEEALEGLLPSTKTPPARLHEAMRYSVFSGGKRLRPILALASCELVGGDTLLATAPGCACELVHTYSLKIGRAHV